MVQGSLDLEKFDLTDTDNIDNKILGFGINRELSFSRWCDNDSGVHLDQQLGNADARREEARDSDFELPFIETDQPHIRYQRKGMHMNGVGIMEDDSVYLNGNRSEKCVPLDIEDGAARQKVVDSTVSLASHGSLGESSSNLVSVPDILKTLFFILLWYTCRLFLTLYNKSLLGDTMGKFPAPFLMNTIHFAMQAVLSNFITWFWSQRFKTSVSTFYVLEGLLMARWNFPLTVVPTALGTALDINLSNASLVFISVTFATMCKSAAPIFLLLFAFAFRLETPSFKLSGIIVVISIGILLTVLKETEFEFWGFVLVMLAAVMSGFHWCMTQILLQKEAYGMKNPLTVMSYVTPVMAGATALLSLALDPWGEFRQNKYFNSPWHITQELFANAFWWSTCFSYVTSAVTVTIAGVVKEAVTILVAVLYFHDQFTWLKGLGLFTIIVGVCLFNWYKYWKLQKGEAGEEDVSGSFKTDSDTKYIILDEMDEQEESA